jgi:outer membrane cobalamin receptor
VSRCRAAGAPCIALAAWGLAAWLAAALGAPAPARADDGAPPAPPANDAAATEAPPTQAPATEPPRPAPTPAGPSERVEVRGTTGETALDPTAFATVIRAEDFADRITTLPELLRETVGVQVKSLGGDFATISIRGSSAEQVMVYLDGVPLNRALGGGVNLADLPLAEVESIEVYRGFTPVALPSASIGGAVLIHTKHGGERRGGTASLSYGSFDTGSLTASATGGREGDAWTAGADAAGSRGDFPFHDINGTEQQAGDDSTTRRVNNDFLRRHLAGRWDRRAGAGTRFGVSADLMSSDQGVPGIGGTLSRSARFGSDRALLRTEAERPGLWGGRLLLRGAVDYLHQADRFTDPDETFTGPSSTRTSSAALGGEAGAVVVAGSHQAISLLVSHRREDADIASVVGSLAPRSTARRDATVVTLEDQVSLASGRVVLNPSLRRERYGNAYDAGTPEGLAPPASLEAPVARTTGKVGFVARVSETVAVRGNCGRYLRIPDFIELFGDRGSVVGNPALLPESGRNLDFGLTAARRRSGPIVRQARVEATLFETAVDDLITLVQNSQSTFEAINLGRARTRGIEMTMDLALGPRFTGGLNVTRQRPIDRSDTYTRGNLLPLRPQDEIGATASLALGRGRVFYAFTYVGPNYTDPSNTQGGLIGARYLHDLGYRVRLPRGLQATVELKNLTDDRTFDVARFPLPGRRVEGRLAWEF